MYKKLFKRLIDILAALLLLIILSPLLIPIVIGLLLTGEHYVFYSQKRVGYKNVRFQILKFATMLKNSPSIGTGSITTRNDPRILPMGKFLRKTKINELPQILNVLLGDMSLVGPRPQMESDFYKFPVDIQECIYNVHPGITGIGSIIFRDEEKWMQVPGMDVHAFYKVHIAPYKGALEVWYLNNLSFRIDMMILFLTIWVIILPESNLVYKVFKNLPKMPESLK
jgi:lipopolysaccharide/colanic/teichoic acid biosynthesis glycosyltransferase